MLLLYYISYVFYIHIHSFYEGTSLGMTYPNSNQYAPMSTGGCPGEQSSSNLAVIPSGEWWTSSRHPRRNRIVSFANSSFNASLDWSGVCTPRRLIFLTHGAGFTNLDGSILIVSMSWCCILPQSINITTKPVSVRFRSLTLSQEVLLFIRTCTAASMPTVKSVLFGRYAVDHDCIIHVSLLVILGHSSRRTHTVVSDSVSDTKTRALSTNRSIDFCCAIRIFRRCFPEHTDFLYIPLGTSSYFTGKSITHSEILSRCWNVSV